MHWPPISNLESVPSPGLLVNPDLVTKNVATMISMVDGDVKRLRPHVKTHKMPAVVRLKLSAGITRFKAATIAEARMVAGEGGNDVLISYPLVGPNVTRFGELIDQFPQTSFACVVDHIAAAESLASEIGNRQAPVRVFIDVDCGMHRTGIAMSDGLVGLRKRIEALSGIQYSGLHVYDGHLHQPSLEERTTSATANISEIKKYESANPSPEIVGGGSPTFPIWADETPWQCSPGTPVFWDHGYGGGYTDLQFDVAAALLTRVISKPGRDLICLDLGHKAVASEMPLDQRVVLPGIQVGQFAGHSEEHLVIATPNADEISFGQAFLAYPRHICPTVALHAYATVIRDYHATGEVWRVTARDR